MVILGLLIRLHEAKYEYDPVLGYRWIEAVCSGRYARYGVDCNRPVRMWVCTLCYAFRCIYLRVVPAEQPCGPTDTGIFACTWDEITCVTQARFVCAGRQAGAGRE